MFRSFGRLFSNGDYDPLKDPNSAMSLEDVHVTLYPQCFLHNETIELEGSSVITVNVRGWVHDNPTNKPLRRKDRLVVGLLRRLVGLPANADAVSDLPPTPSEMSEIDNSLPSTEGTKSSAFSGLFSRFVPAQTVSPLIKELGFETCKNHFEKRISLIVSRGISGERVRVTVYAYDQEYRTVQVAQFSTITNEQGYFEVNNPIPYCKSKGNKFMVKAIVVRTEKLGSPRFDVLKDVCVLDSTGVSVLSDIDDTIKDTRVYAGSRAVAQSTLLQAVDRQNVPGVSDWFRNLYNHGTSLHLVSNSPWQLWPMLRVFFDCADLPFISSVHLKHYNGVLQSLMEHAAERKRHSLINAARMLGDRRLFLIGDNSEQDPALYAEFSASFPDRVLGIFIRDVLTDHCTAIGQKLAEEVDVEDTVKSLKSLEAQKASQAPAHAGVENDEEEEVGNINLNYQPPGEVLHIEKIEGADVPSYTLHSYYIQTVPTDDYVTNTTIYVERVQHSATVLRNIHLLSTYPPAGRVTNRQLQLWYRQLAKYRSIVPEHIPFVIWHHGDEACPISIELLRQAFDNPFGLA
ncbi:actin cortical patch protein [Schizosaccharomyces japonicus yFS275]|uniref:Actin cortical patch protein n=1 Tax=Schizosaccharomyces japonicus (strain yFS275 / FY16936) TaxID=402676 RepID=B6JWZ5_SCHJY|nr:actin cortical patch protein [Schizosaccharomyces japonicus yFS275]EEB05896.1 actin cortical patch protein [Schizosaccharomyces japonicus yFS275]